MPVYLNLTLCMFLLCASGAVSGPLRRAQIHPAVASMMCLGTMFFSVFEEIQLLPRLFVNVGGFFFPLAGGALLLAQGPRGKRRYLAAFIALTALIGYLTSQVAADLTDVWFHGAPWIAFAACIVSGALFCGEHHGALLCAVLGYYATGVMQYLFIVLPQGWTTLTLGGGADALPCVLIFPVTLALCEGGRLLSGAFRKRSARKAAAPPKKTQSGDMPPVTPQTEHQSA